MVRLNSIDLAGSLGGREKLLYPEWGEKTNRTDETIIAHRASTARAPSRRILAELCQEPGGQRRDRAVFGTLKEQLLWLNDFRDRYNANWTLQRHGYLAPNHVLGE